MGCLASIFSSQGGELNLDISGLGDYDVMTELDDDFTPYGTPMKGSDHGSRSGSRSGGSRVSDGECQRTPTQKTDVVQNLRLKFINASNQTP